MREVAIVGAGDLGGALADVLARRDVASTIRLVDESGPAAAGKALDIAQAAPIDGFSTALSGTTDISVIAGADVVVVADRFGGAEWQHEEGLVLLRRMTRLASNAVIVCSGSSARELVEAGVRELRFERARLIGSAPEALAAAVRAIVALEASASPADVGLMVLGIPPSQVVVPWSDVSIGGFAATRVLDEPAMRRIGARLDALWPPGPYALAAAAMKVIEVVSGRSRQLVSCFVAPDDSEGTRARAAALPVDLGPTGVRRVILPSLSIHDRLALDNAMLL